MKDYTRYLYIPFLHKGNTFAGADCWGLLDLFYQTELGIKIPVKELDYNLDWWKQEDSLTETTDGVSCPMSLLSFAKKYNFKPCPPTHEGAAIIFKNTNKVCGHIGILLTNYDFLHMTKSGAIISNLLRSPYQKMLVGTYKLSEDALNAYKIR